MHNFPREDSYNVCSVWWLTGCYRHLKSALGYKKRLPTHAVNLLNWILNNQFRLNLDHPKVFHVHLIPLWESIYIIMHLFMPHTSIWIALFLNSHAHFSTLNLDFKMSIEGLHDAVHTYTRTILPPAWFPFLKARYTEKQQKCLKFLFTLQNDLKFPPCVCVCVC